VAEAVVTGADLGLCACPSCGRAAPPGRCPRCGGRVGPPDRRALQAVWALLLAGVVAYVPANLYPMLVTRTLFSRTDSTIVGGAIDLARHGSWFVAAVVFVASVVIPVTKFAVIGWLAATIARGSAADPKRRRRLHHAVEAIGRWSMIDVFVVAVLAALVQLGFLASIEPGPAAAPFAASVVLTMLAAQRLDPRLIWTEGDRHDR
jgi:paraquat-inducible protein A